MCWKEDLHRIADSLEHIERMMIEKKTGDPWWVHVAEGKRRP